MIEQLPVIELLLFMFVLGTAVATAALRDVLGGIIVFGAYSLGMAMYYTVLLAPDVAMTEAAVAAGVTTVLLLLTIAKTANPSHTRIIEQLNIPALIIAAGFVVVLVMIVPAFPAIGETNAVNWDNPVTQYYISQTYPDTGAHNMVAAVLAAYRGFDTFGEAIVVFAAGIAALIVLRWEGFIDA